MDNRYNIIIAGAGASGLSLLWQILHSDALRDRSVLLTDRSLSPSDDKTWCFWNDRHIPYPELIHHTWNRLTIRGDGSEIHSRPRETSYHCMRSRDFTSRILTLAEASPRVDLLEAGIRTFRSEQNLGIMETDSGTYRADMIFQSALPVPGFQNLKTDISLKQHFLGWEIRTDEPCFDPGRAMFMDFDIPQKNGVTFMYLLPFSEREALVEYTLFSPELLESCIYEEAIRNYLSNRYSLSSDHYTITRTERGSIPMEDRRYPARFCPNVYNIGTHGGLTKPSTGYTFTRAHRHVKGIVSQLETNRPVSVKGESAYRFRVYDMMLLRLLRDDPETARQIFCDLFRYNSYGRIFRFLDEETTFTEELEIFSTLPYIPFFKSIWKMKHRIFTGA
jgi:lycopene beta-cyclase